jgi:hypothetical protein
MKTGGNESGMKADVLRFPTPSSRSVAVKRPPSSEPDLVVAQGGDQRAYAGLGIVLGFVQDAVFLRGFHHPVFGIATGFLDQLVVSPDLEEAPIPIVEFSLVFV